MTVKYEPSCLRNTKAKNPQFFIQAPCDNSASELQKFSMVIIQPQNYENTAWGVKEEQHNPKSL